MRTILSYCQEFPETNVDSGEVLLNEGGRTGVLYILIEGQIEVLKREIRVAIVTEPGAIFGEMSVLLDLPHSATVKTVMPSRLYVVERASEFLRSHTDIAYQLARLLAQRLHGVTTYLVDLKHQFQDQDNHLGMVDEVLKALINQQNEECDPGSDRYPDRTV